MKRNCGACNGTRYIEGNQCRICSGTGLEEATREHVYFTLYDLPAMRSKTFVEAQARCLDHVGHKYIRLEIVDEGNGLEIKEAKFIDEAELQRERESSQALLETMKDDLNGEIEG